MHQTTVTCRRCGITHATEQSPWAIHVPEGWKGEAGLYEAEFTCPACLRPSWRARGRQLAGVVLVSAAVAIAVVAGKFIEAWW